MSPELKGYLPPLTPEGRAQLFYGPPWYSCAAIMGINFKADPKEIQKLLPEPYTLSAAGPADCSCWFGDWIFLSESAKDMLVRNPERAQYRECAIYMRCRVKGVEGIRCPYMWCDNDFAVALGVPMGFPKRMGRIHLGFSKTKLYALNDGLGEVGPGTRFGAFLEAHGERLITGTIKLSRRISPKELPPPFGLPRYNMVYVPSGSAGAKPLVHQIIKWLNPEDPPPSYGDVWSAGDATLTFNESELEEYTAIKPLEITGAYYVEMGATIIKGTTVVHEW